MWISILLSLALIVASSDIVLAQEKEDEEKGKAPRVADEGERGRRGRDQRAFDGEAGERRRGRWPDGMFGMGGLRNTGVAIFANAKYVYVVHGNTLYQFTAEDLELVNEISLQPKTPPAGRPVEQKPQQ